MSIILTHSVWSVYVLVMSRPRILSLVLTKEVEAALTALVKQREQENRATRVKVSRTEIVRDAILKLYAAEVI